MQVKIDGDVDSLTPDECRKLVSLLTKAGFTYVGLGGLDGLVFTLDGPGLEVTIGRFSVAIDSDDTISITEHRQRVAECV